MQLRAFTTCLALLALIFLALALRLRGLDFLLPFQGEPDADLVMQVALFEGAQVHPEQAPQYARYPHLISRAVTLFTVGDRDSVRLPDLDRYPEQTAAAYVRVRWVVALLSLLAVPATWLLARIYLPPAWSLLAASAMVTSLLALWFAQEARPHAGSMALPALAVVSCVALRRRGSLGAYILAGMACGVATGGLQSGIAVLLPLLAAHFSVDRPRPWHAQARLLVSLAITALCIRVFYPFFFATDGVEKVPVALAGKLLNLGGHKIFLNLFNGSGLPKVWWDLWSYDPALFLGSMLGIGAWVVQRTARHPTVRANRADQLVVLAYAIPYFTVIALYQRSYQRFLLPLLPFLACLSAYGLLFTVRQLSRHLGSAGRVAAGLLIALWLGFPALAAERLTHARAAPSTIELAGVWLRRHATPGTNRVALGPSFRLPLPEAPCVVFAIPASDLPQIARAPRGYLASLRADYVAIEVFAAGRRNPALGMLRDTLAQMASLAVRLSPDGDPMRSEQPISFQDDEVPDRDHASTRILQARRVGPVIEIYRMAGT